ncbi:MAG: tagaturonate epimerase family protein [Bacteroidota bacterium]
MQLPKYSFGIGDRFGKQGEAQLAALQQLVREGIGVVPVWNKSNREHVTIGSEPLETRLEADAAVKNLNWPLHYFVDADHINLETVDRYIEHCDFFTIDVAAYIGQKASNEHINKFLLENKNLAGPFKLPGIEAKYFITPEDIRNAAEKFLFAIHKAGEIYRRIHLKKGNNFVTEISMDEVEEAQTPTELFFILNAIAAEGIPAQTIAPKFTGRFNKGVDYHGDVNLFEKEFEEDLMVIDLAIKKFNLPENLKLSVHSGSDKFTIYPVMGKLIKKHNKGIHVKTAGTTWLEEVIGLAMAGGEALKMVKEIYTEAIDRFDELCNPYATVIDIDKAKLPSVQEIQKWNGETFANSLRHIPGHPLYNPHFRQLMHVGYKLAAERGNIFTEMLTANKEITGKQVTENIYERHLKRLFNL